MRSSSRVHAAVTEWFSSACCFRRGQALRVYKYTTLNRLMMLLSINSILIFSYHKVIAHNDSFINLDRLAEMFWTLRCSAVSAAFGRMEIGASTGHLYLYIPIFALSRWREAVQGALRRGERVVSFAVSTALATCRYDSVHLDNLLRLTDKTPNNRRPRTGFALTSG